MQIALQEGPDISRPWRWLEVNPADPIRLDALEAADDFAPRRSSHKAGAVFRRSLRFGRTAHLFRYQVTSFLGIRMAFCRHVSGNL